MFYETTFRPLVEDFGKGALLTPKAILRMFENSASYHSDMVGQGFENMNKKGLSWFLSEWDAEFIRPVKFNDTVRVSTWSRGLSGHFTVNRDYTLSNEGGELCAIASSQWVVISHESMSITKITDDILLPYESEDRSVFGDKKQKRLREPKEYQSETKITVRRSDIDVNGHVNNICYIDYAFEALPQEIFDTLECSGIRASYRKETKANEILTCRCSCGENSYTVGIYGEDEVLRAVAEIKMKQ